MAKLLVTASSLGSNPDIPQKITNRRLNQKSCQPTHSKPLKKQTKKRVLEGRIHKKHQDSMVKIYLYIYAKEQTPREFRFPWKIKKSSKEDFGFYDYLYIHSFLSVKATI